MAFPDNVEPSFADSQIQVLKEIQKILYDARQGTNPLYSLPGSTGGGTVTPSVSVATASGSVAAGAYSVEFIFGPTFAGTIGGVAYSGTTDAKTGWQAPPGFKLGALAYTISAGSMRIQKVS